MKVILRLLAALITLFLADPCGAQSVGSSALNGPPARNFYLSWGNNNLKGDWPFAPGLTSYSVLIPNGNPPTQADLSSQRYNHHTRVKAFNGRVWVAHSSGGTSEDAPGQMCVVHSSANNWSTQTGPVLVVPPQSTYSGTGASRTAGTNVSYPRSFVVYNGNLYLVCAVDQFSETDSQIGMALLAAQCNSDGTVGATFQVSVASYTPQVGPSFTYDPVLGPPIFQLANLWGMWGGSYPGQPPSAWIGWLLTGATYLVEPDTIAIDSSGTSLSRLWRQNNGTVAYQWEQLSQDGGNTWTFPQLTNIPNDSSPTAGIRLPDGRIFFAGNADNLTVSRDPLYLAGISNFSLGVSDLYAIQQGLSGVCVYPDASKFGGASYPGIDFDGTNLWISYSICKEQIWVTSIPISGL
jgi:hypothetical protein